MPSICIPKLSNSWNKIRKHYSDKTHCRHFQAAFPWLRFNVRGNQNWRQCTITTVQKLVFFSLLWKPNQFQKLPVFLVHFAPTPNPVKCSTCVPRFWFHGFLLHTRCWLCLAVWRNITLFTPLILKRQNLWMLLPHMTSSGPCANDIYDEISSSGKMSHSPYWGFIAKRLGINPKGFAHIKIYWLRQR